jgi:hypothetical protein
MSGLRLTCVRSCNGVFKKRTLRYKEVIASAETLKGQKDLTI